MCSNIHSMKPIVNNYKETLDILLKNAKIQINTI